MNSVEVTSMRPLESYLEYAASNPLIFKLNTYPHWLNRASLFSLI